jgi:hypothetical protein
MPSWKEDFSGQRTNFGFGPDAANSDRRSLWADVFDTNFEHIFAVQDKIADSIIGGFTKRLGSESLASAPKRDTENVEAYKEFIKGRYYWSKRTTEGFDKALRCFQKRST